MKQIKLILLMSLPFFFLTSCEKESNQLERQGKRTISSMTYEFPTAVTKGKSGVPHSTVLATTPIEIDGHTYTLQLSSEIAPTTKGTIYQPVSGANIYTFYSYAESIIKEQEVTLNTNPPKRDFEVPVDEATKYRMIFLAKSSNSASPTTFTLPPKSLDKKNKKITFTAQFNENLCYKDFDVNSMPSEKEVPITFTPLFSQLELSVPTEVDGATITINEIKILSGIQQRADVTIDKTAPKMMTYAKSSTDYTRTLQIVKVANTWTFQKTIYNLIPNDNPFKIRVSIKIGSKIDSRTIEKEIELNSQSKSLLPCTRYKLELISKIPEIKLNIRPISVLFSKEIANLQTNQPLSFEVTSEGTKLDNNRVRNIQWKLEPKKGSFVSLSNTTSQTPDLLYDNTNANEHDYAELILTGTDEFGRTCADTISVLVGDLPAWRWADYDVAPGGKIATYHSYSTSDVYYYSQAASFTNVQFNGYSYHFPSQSEANGILSTEFPTHRSMAESTVENVTTTYGPIVNKSYKEHSWNARTNTSQSEPKMQYAGYSVKLYTEEDYSHACAYRYRLVYGFSCKSWRG